MVEDAGGRRAESVFGADDRVRVGDTGAFPWAAIGRVTVTAETGVARGTGFLVGDRHLLTAGHVVHDAGFGGDGWADALVLAPGLDGAVAPFGRAEAVALRADPAWIAEADPGADWALVTLDRSLGAALGAFPLFAAEGVDHFDGAPVTLAGYPGDLGGDALYAAAGTVAEGTPDRLFYAGTLDTAGGMSGAPLWQGFSGTGERVAIGVHAAGAVDPGAPGARNAATRLTAERIALIEEWIAQDAALRPPVDRPDLADDDAVFARATAVLPGAPLRAGAAFAVEIGLRNLGTRAAEGYEVAFYASANARITEFDIPLGRVAGPALAPFESARLAAALRLPASAPAGSFHLGWVIDADGALAEFDEANNTGLAEARLEVLPAPDLVAGDLAAERLAWRPGESVAVSWTVRNAGGAAAPPVDSALFLSPDPAITAEDIEIARVTLATGLAPGTSAPASVTVSDDGSLPRGDYYLGALADPDGALAVAAEGAGASRPLAVHLGRPGAFLAGTDAAEGIAGGEGDDTLWGYLGADTLAGREGADRIDGWGDDDRIFGDGGPDDLLGGFGFDTLFGNDGADRLQGDLGDGRDGQGDVLSGGPGDDTLLGEGGADTLYGGPGDDRLEGGPDFDQLWGEAGDDTLLGGDIRDTLDGGEGADRLEGGSGDDELVGGPGADRILGGAGADFVDAGPEDDTVEAGAGDDIVIGGAGADRIEGGAGIDHVLAGSGADHVLGGEGDDALFGEAGADRIEGGSGDDLIFGNAGDDWAEGGPGRDSLVGEDGADTLVGGAGGDLLAGRAGPDSLSGEAGDDLIDGEGADDRLAGGDGADTLFGRDGADRLAGGPGADFLAGGAGPDTLEAGPGDDRIGGDAGADVFLFAPGDGADLIFDLAPGIDRVLIAGGVGSLAAASQGTDPAGWLTLGYSDDPGDRLTLQGLRPGDLLDDGTIAFV